MSLPHFVVIIERRRCLTRRHKDTKEVPVAPEKKDGQA